MGSYLVGDFEEGGGTKAGGGRRSTFGRAFLGAISRFFPRILVEIRYIAGFAGSSRGEGHTRRDTGFRLFRILYLVLDHDDGGQREKRG